MSKSALFSMLYRPFLPWKHAERNFREARERGFETVVAWDHRNSRSDYERICALADTVVPFTSHGHCEGGYKVVSKVKSEFALLMADDERASENLWLFAADPPMAARYCVLVVPIKDGRMHGKHVGSQERLIWTEGWRWVPRTMPNGVATLFESHSQSPLPVTVLEDELGCVIWHYLLDAPRAEREEKAARYTAIDPWGEHATRLFYEEQGPGAFSDLPPFLKPHLPRG